MFSHSSMIQSRNPTSGWDASAWSFGLLAQSPTIDAYLTCLLACWLGSPPPIRRLWLVLEYTSWWLKSLQWWVLGEDSWWLRPVGPVRSFSFVLKGNDQNGLAGEWFCFGCWSSTLSTMLLLLTDTCRISMVSVSNNWWKALQKQRKECSLWNRNTHIIKRNTHIIK